MMNLSLRSRLSSRPDLRSACSGETRPERWRIDHEWPPSQRTAQQFPRGNEPLLDHAGELTDPPALLSQDVLGAGGHDDDLGPGGGHADLHTRVTILGQLTGQELVQLSFENSVSDELPLLGDLCRHTSSLVEVNQAILAW